jgi:hypothetical protein
MYGAGILLEFFMAVGASAAVALLFSWQQGQPAGESGGTDRSGTPEGTLSETTGEVPALESTVRGTPASPTGAAPRKPTDEAPFVHCAKDENSRGDYIYIDDPRIDGEPDAVVIVSPTPYQGRTETNAYAHNISVWYEPVARKWAILNQNLAPVPPGATFDVSVPRASEPFEIKRRRKLTHSELSTGIS